MQGNPQHLQELSALAKQVDSDMPDEKMTARAIAGFQSGLIQFMENALGPLVSVNLVRLERAAHASASACNAAIKATGSQHTCSTGQSTHASQPCTR